MTRECGVHPLRSMLKASTKTDRERVHISYQYVQYQPLDPFLTLGKVNRNKKSLGLSFATPDGVEILHKLVKECDVLVENYLPRSLKKRWKIQIVMYWVGYLTEVLILKNIWKK